MADKPTQPSGFTNPTDQQLAQPSDSTNPTNQQPWQPGDPDQPSLSDDNRRLTVDKIRDMFMNGELSVDKIRDMFMNGELNGDDVASMLGTRRVPARELGDMLRITEPITTEGVTDVAIASALTADKIRDMFNKAGVTADKVWEAVMGSLPSGCIFRPNDKYLILEYLMRKINGRALPPNDIHEVDSLFDFDPECLAERYKSMEKDEWYFFTKSNKYEGNARWKFMDDDDVVEHESVQIGYRGTMYSKMNYPEGEKAWWVMYVYRAKLSRYTVKLTPDMDWTVDDIALCKLFKDNVIELSEKQIILESEVDMADGASVDSSANVDS